MGQLPTSVLLGLGQLFDGAVLRILLKSVAMSLLTYVVACVVGWFVLDSVLGWTGLDEGTSAYMEDVRGIAAALLVLLGLWLVWRIVAMAVFQFYAEDIVRAVEVAHYPEEMQTARDLTFAQQLGQALKAALRTLLFNLLAAPIALVLIFTAVGPALVFWIVNAFLLGRELQDLVWLRYQQGKGRTSPIAKPSRFLLGGAVAGLLAVPFVQFLAPVLGAATATHLVHRSERARYA